MLALAASYGVYKFNLLFTPLWVALVSAAAFELVYVGLSVARLADGERRRASIIAASAVAVSVVYNSLAALFHIRPDLLVDRPLWADISLAVLHGLPLAVLAYFVAQLLLHSSEPAGAPAPADMVAARYDSLPPPVARYACPSCGAGLSQQQYGAAVKYGHCNDCKGVC
jgi:hypothetical protein